MSSRNTNVVSELYRITTSAELTEISTPKKTVFSDVEELKLASFPTAENKRHKRVFLIVPVGTRVGSKTL